MSKYESKCSCGAAKEKKAKKCGRCSNISNSPYKRLPPDDVILVMLTKKSAAKVAKELGVSITSIKNIKLKYNK